MVFIIVAGLCIYLICGRWSGISSVHGYRKVIGTGRDSDIVAGTTLEVHFLAKIPGVWPIPYVTIKECLSREGGEEHMLETFGIPDRRRQVEVSYRTPALRRGVYRFGVTNCVTEDIFGLFQHKGRLDLPDKLLVLPQKVHIREWKQLHQIFQGFRHHNIKSQSFQESAQMNGIREFINGDRLSRIHWNATAKTGTWKSKEFEKEALPRIIIVLDRNMHAYRSKEQFELAVSIAASLIDYLTANHLSVGLVSVGKHIAYLESKAGTSHQKAITNHLIDAEPDGTNPLLSGLKDRSRQINSGSLLVFISPEYGDATVPLISWAQQRRLKPCHMWVASGVPVTEQEQWRRHLQTTGVMGYAVTSLEELALVLGGRI
ncbi:DUF58 domain-containing protein [Paenibacillus sp. LPE1-1-1.1]|uniref:DUF58 domain-containing protein n=1 Tax=Paenibacillus sp. LPE1-1-1.1 TaxID=3135230 RepID=UPI003446C57C